MVGPPSEHFVLEETDPHLAVGKASGDKLKSTNDLVEKVIYLYVRVVKAKDLPQKDVGGTYVEVNLGNLKDKTFLYKKKSNPKWSKVFTFTKDDVQSNVLEATVKSKNDIYMGRVLFDIKEVSSGTRFSPHWYKLEDKEGNLCKGQLMLAVWWGTQADEAFSNSRHISAATSNHATDLGDTRAKVYLSPKLWYLRVNVIEAEGLMATERTFVKAILGNQTMRTRDSTRKSTNPLWNEDLMFVAAEPFDELFLSVEDRVSTPGKDEVIGRCVIPLQHVDIRLDHKPLNSKWYELVEDAAVIARIHLRICLEGGYHVFDESTPFSSDFRPTAEKLWKSSIGVLEVGIVSAHALSPMKIINGRETIDAYCVAKYGQKWVRTRTIKNSLAPKWDELYAWNVFDPCTVITIGVFDNCHFEGDKASRGKDSPIGKVRIRLSTLETDRIYTHLYPLLILQPTGVKKMGEIHLALRFTCTTSLINVIHMYSRPQLPKMHYAIPFTLSQIESLRFWAKCIVSERLSYSEPPLQRQVVHFMLDSDFDKWSMRKSKATFYRIMSAVSVTIAFARWFEAIRYWRNPITTILVHILFLAWVLYPVLFLPTIFLYLFFIGVCYYRERPRHPLHIDPRLSQAVNVHFDEMDEEFDTFPTSCPDDILIRMRYDRLRSLAGRIQSVAGNFASFAERLQYLLLWRDTRATALFIVFCLVAAIVLYYAPLQLALLTVFYVLRHPSLRQMHPVPSLPLNFLKRLPSRDDCML